jgi:exopolysaccharide biosynthesis polyprenyl glycosylphosphotransferase
MIRRVRWGSLWNRPRIAKSSVTAGMVTTPIPVGATGVTPTDQVFRRVVTDGSSLTPIMLWRKRRRERATAAQVLLLSDLICLTLPVVWNRIHVLGLLTGALLTCGLFWLADLYRPRLQALVLDDFPILLGRLLAAMGIVATVSALRHPSYGVATYLDCAAEAVVLTLLGRTIVTLCIRTVRHRRLVLHNVIIVGTGPVADRLTRTLATVPAYGLFVAGYVADHATPGSRIDSTPYLGPIRSLRRKIDQLGAELVLICDQGFADTELAMIVRQALWNDCDILMVPRLHEVSRQAWVSDMIGSIPVVRLGPGTQSGVQWKCKRIFDILVSAIALVLLAPLLALCALLVRLDGGRGVFFRQIRVGRDARPFEIVKFRTLRPADDHESGTKWSIKDDDRVTRFGRFLRRTSLDELPQLWTILRGDMTIVGPRPERPHFVEQFSVEEPTYVYRHRVPAGLTGLAQVNGMRGDTSIQERSYFDNYYIENWSLWLDIKVILRTFSEVFLAHGG